MPYVSIIMPVYNAERTCGRAIESVLGQTYRDFELIIIDDGSSDNSFEICSEFMDRDERIRLLHKENGGVSSARNMGLEASVGKYAAFIDSDDAYDSLYLEKMVSAAAAADADIAVCGYFCTQKGKVFQAQLPDDDDNIDELRLSLLKKSAGLNYLWNKLYRRSLIEENFNTAVSMGEDLEFICAFVVRAERFTVINEPLYYYTADSENSLTKKTELLTESVAHDMAVLKKYSEAIGIGNDIAAEKLFGRTEGILGNIEKYKDFKAALDSMESDMEYRALIEEMTPQKRKNRLLRWMIRNKADKTLYLYLYLKRFMRKNFKRQR